MFRYVAHILSTTPRVSNVNLRKQRRKGKGKEKSITTCVIGINDVDVTSNSHEVDVTTNV